MNLTTFTTFSITLYFRPKRRANEFYPDLASPSSVLSKVMSFFAFVVMIKLQVRVLRLMKMHEFFNVPPCIIWTPCIIWFRHGTSGIFELWAFRKYILLCASNVHNKEHAPLKKKIGAFFSIFWCETFFLTYRWLVARYVWITVKPKTHSVPLLGKECHWCKVWFVQGIDYLIAS